MRGQGNPIQKLMYDIYDRSYAPQMIATIGIAFLVLLAFVMTQGTSEDAYLEKMGDKTAGQYVCENIETLGASKLCIMFACGTLGPGFDAKATSIGNDVDTSCSDPNNGYKAGFEKLVDSCTPYCRKGWIQVGGVSKSVSGVLNAVFGKTRNQCVFLSGSAMRTVVTPVCTDKGVLSNDARLCVQGFECSIQQAGRTTGKCKCSSLVNFTTAIDQAGSTLPNLITFADGYYSSSNPNTDNFVNTCGQDFTIGDGAKYMSFIAKAYPAETPDTLWNSFIKQEFPNLICILYFGLMPFGVTYLLIGDMLFFVPLSDSTKNIVAGLASMFSILFGTFSNVSILISKLASWSLSTSFMVVIFGTAVFGAALKIVMETMLINRERNKQLIEFAASLGELAPKVP